MIAWLFLHLFFTLEMGLVTFSLSGFFSVAFCCSWKIKDTYTNVVTIWLFFFYLFFLFSFAYFYFAGSLDVRFEQKFLVEP